ncbi:SH3 domain-containing protein [Streptomyces sp. NPDC006430]|uniref:SH3 domain-containing protein n=1 Tax=Streptomyces sp. NPDC006430 TaxID=3154299 RepID=UPI0033B760AA
MQKPTRTILALAAGSLVLGLVGAGTAVADEDPMADTPSQGVVADEPENDQSGAHHDRDYAVGKVVSHGPLKLRSGPSTRFKAVGQVKPRHKVAIVCKTHGESIDGNDLWYRLHPKEEHGQRPGDEKKEQGQRPGDEREEHGQRPGDEKKEHGQRPGDEREEHGQRPGDEKKEHGQRPGDEREEHGQRPGDEKKEHGQRPGDEKQSSDESLEGDDRNGKEEKEIWVAARYVKNQDDVKWCD